MEKLRDIPVGRKLAVIITLTTMTALFLIAAAFITYDYYSSRRLALDELEAVGRMLAANSAAAVAFNDLPAATEVLSTLEKESEIQTACIYDLFGRLLAEYHRSPGQSCPANVPMTTTVAFADSGAICRQPILLHDMPEGYLYLDSDLSKMRIRRSRFVTITAIFLLAALGMAALVGSILRRWVTAPIVELAAVMQKVSKFRNYSLRGTPRGQDEIGALVAGFNQMLTEIQNSQSRLECQALTDELTGLPNRRLLADRLAHALAVAERQQAMVALLYLDLDGFKLINDTLGHSIGDFLLQEVAGRLRERVRASDTLARIGGDEFTVVVGNIRGPEEAALAAQELLAQLAAPFKRAGHELTLTASMGISLYPSDALDAEQLIQHADTAMYVAKGAGKNGYKLFSAEFGDLVRERLELENQLRGAVERGEFAVHYQPEFDLDTQRLVRFEALARWRHPTLGMIPPDKFIPIAEETGLIGSIGFWVMEQACSEAVRWQNVAQDAVQVAVNVSTLQFFRDDFVETVARILTQTGLDPKLLQLELTESVFMPGVGDSATKMSVLRSLGISMAVDDFGTGYSILSYLPRLPFDCLKIDRSFLQQTSSSGDARALLNSLVSLTHDLKMKVIVEGVETPEQLTLLQEVGCDQIQGFLFGRPTADPDQHLFKERERLRRRLGLKTDKFPSAAVEQPGVVYEERTL